MDLRALAAAVEAALRAVRPRVLAAWHEDEDARRFKEDGTVVTDLDHAVEEDLAEALLAVDPAFGLKGEESGWIRRGQPAWHVDPVDGTANYARRIGAFGTQLALVEGDEPLLAAIYEPLADTFAWAARGEGAWHEGRRLEIADRPPERALVMLDIADTGLFADRPELLLRIRRGCYKMRALGTVALQTRDVARGAADAYLGGRRSRTPLHDLAPGVLMVREAGGRVSDGRGGDPMVERRALVAGGPQVHDWLCTLLAEGAPR